MIKVKFIQPFKDGVIALKQFKIGDEIELTESQYKYLISSARGAVVVVVPQKAEKPSAKS